MEVYGFLWRTIDTMKDGIMESFEKFTWEVLGTMVMC